MTRWLKSPCCGEPVVVPVDVTVHRRVTADGVVSTTLRDQLSWIAVAAAEGDWHIREAYCERCGQSVRVIIYG